MARKQKHFQYSIVLQDEKKWYYVNSDAFGELVLDEKYNKAATQ